MTRKNSKYTDADNQLLLTLRDKKVPFASIAALMPEHSQDSLRCQAWILRQGNTSHWSKQEKVGFFDIETTDFKADRGFMLSWAIKDRDGETVCDRITKKEIFKGTFDQRIVKSFVEELPKFDLVVGFYSTKFDVPFSRTRALMLGLPYPKYGTLMHNDLFYTVRGKLCMHNKTLDTSVTTLTGKSDKTRFDIGVWRKAAYGDDACLDAILEHNVIDVDLTQQVFEILLPFVKMTRKSI